MASNVVSIFIDSDSSKLTKAFREAETSGEKLKAGFGLIAKAAVAALAFKAAQAVKDFVGDSVRAFSDLNESLNALEVTYGEHAEGIKQIGEEAAQNLGLSNAEFNSFAVQISAFAQQIAGDSGDVVGTVDELSQRVTDFASVMNLDVAEAAEKFQSGLAGESEPLRKFGIDVSAAKVEAFAFANGIASAGEELTEAQKVQARYGTIMEQTEKVQGDFANTVDDYANAQRVANAELENSKALLGETLVPLATLGTEMQSGLAKAVNEAAIAFGELTEAFEGGEAALLSFKNETGKSASSVADAMRGVELSWQSWTKEIDIWDDALFGGTNRIDDMVGALEGLIDEQELSRDGIGKLRDELDGLRDSGELTEEQYEALSDVLDVRFNSALTDQEKAARASFDANEDLRGSFQELDQTMEESAEATAESAQKSREEFADLAQAAEEEFAKAEQDVDDFITGFEELPERQEITLDEWIENMQERTAAIEQWYRNLNILAANGMEQFAEEMIQGGFDATHGMVEEAVDTIGTEKGRLLESTAAAANDVGRELARGMAGGIQQYAGEIGEAAVAAVNAAVARARKAAHIESPSKLMAEEIGKPLAEGIAKGIEDSDAPGDALSSTVTTLPRVNGSGGGTGGVQVFVSGTVVTEHDLVEAVERGLQAKARRNGSLGI